MMLVPSYQVIEFLDWLRNRQVRLDREHFDRAGLEPLAAEYLTGAPTEAVYFSGSDPLLFVLTVFQSCPMIEESTVVEQMEHFSGCGSCLQYLLREQVPIRPAELHPLLRRFLNFLEESREYRRPWRLRGEIGGRWHWPPDRPLPEAERCFQIYIREHGGEIREAFRDFMEVAPRDLVWEYERWRSEHRERGGRERRFDDTRRSSQKIENGTIPLGIDERPEDAARRLVGSVDHLLRGGFYGESKLEDPHFGRLFRLITGGFENIGQSLEFLEWLLVNHPNVDIAGDIPSEKAIQLVYSFCEDRGYSNAVSFAKEVEEWLRGEGDANLLSRLWNFVMQAKGSRQRYNHNTPPFSRYKTVPMHGMFLFLSSGDFPSFIETHWEDLNQLTGDYLDVYYGKVDLKRRVSGYETLEQFKTLVIRTTDLPALVLWQTALKDAHVVPLSRLDHPDVVEVVKRIVQGIREKKCLDDISVATSSWVEDRLNKVRSLEVGGYVKNKFVINGGENVQVFNEPQEKVVAVAATHGASISGNVFNLEDAPEVALSDDDILKLRAVANKIQGAAENGNMPRSLASEASAHVWRILEAHETGGADETKAAVSKWRRWFGGLDGRALKLLGSIADAVSLGLPLAKLLGFPVP